MNNRINYLKNCLRFASEMVIKHTGLLKEWQHIAINNLDLYCKGELSSEDYIKFIRAYNKVLIQHEYWIARVSFLQYEINVLKGGINNAELNNADC